MVAGGTLQDDGSGVLADITTNSSSTTVNAGATLDSQRRRSIQAIHNLKGNGSVVTGTVGRTTLTLFVDDSTSSTFGGVISGPGAVDGRSLPAPTAR